MKGQAMATEGPVGPGWKAAAVTAEVTFVLRSGGATRGFGGGAGGWGRWTGAGGWDMPLQSRRSAALHMGNGK